MLVVSGPVHIIYILKGSDITLLEAWLQQWVKTTEGQPSGFSGTSLQNFSMAFSTPHALKIDLLHILSDFRMF